MRIIFGILQKDEKCFECKQKILEHVKKMGYLRPQWNPSITDLSPHLRLSEENTENVRRAVILARSQPQSKAILLCRTGRTVEKIAKELGIESKKLGIQNKTPLEDIPGTSFLLLGYSFEWENTRDYLDSFFSKWR